MTLSKTIGIAMTAAALVLSACASDRNRTDTTQSRSAGEFTSDAALTARVKTAIASDAGLGSAAAINVQTYRGTVQLSGFVDSADKIERAAAAARNVEGVRNVENNIQVKPAS